MKLLCTAMAKAFAEIEAAAKSADNPFFHSKYADLKSVVGAIKPALISHDLFFTQSTHEAEGGVCVETVVSHISGEQMSFGKLYVPANKKDAQGFGSALTYARRYSLMTAFGVPAEDDDGNAAAKSIANDEAPREKVPGITKIKERLNLLMREGNAAADLAAFNAMVHVAKTDLTTIKEANHDYWTGDGEDSEGFKAWIVRRREELAPTEESLTYQLLVSTLGECETPAALQNWLGKHGEAVETLSDEEEAKFGKLFDAHEAGLAAVAQVSA